jgi:hypothetical protein
MGQGWKEISFKVETLVVIVIGGRGANKIFPSQIEGRG